MRLARNPNRPSGKSWRSDRRMVRVQGVVRLAPVRPLSPRKKNPVYLNSRLAYRARAPPPTHLHSRLLHPSAPPCSPATLRPADGQAGDRDRGKVSFLAEEARQRRECRRGCGNEMGPAQWRREAVPLPPYAFCLKKTCRLPFDGRAGRKNKEFQR
jgi:hypothetical protein